MCSAQYRSYIHVERLDNLQDFLNGTIYITPKIDGTNAVVWYNKDIHKVCGGSRRRELNDIHDNAGFYHWINNSHTYEAEALSNFVAENPNLIIYGEWTGDTKFIGHIKTYNPDALGTLRIFDVFDVDAGEYLHDDVWRSMIKDTALSQYAVPILTILENPTIEDLIKVAESNHYLLDNVDHAGEGIVCRNHDYRDAWGNYHIAKIVLDEWKQTQGKPKGKVESKRVGCEEAIVTEFLTDAELTKAVAKVCNACNEDSFDNKSGKMVGMFLNLVFTDLVEENIMAIMKKFKRPIINFKTLQQVAYAKARKFVGLA